MCEQSKQIMIDATLENRIDRNVVFDLKEEKK